MQVITTDQLFTPTSMATNKTLVELISQGAAHGTRTLSVTFIPVQEGNPGKTVQFDIVEEGYQLLHLLNNSKDIAATEWVRGALAPYLYNPFCLLVPYVR